MKKSDAVLLMVEDESSIRSVFDKQLRVLEYRSPEFAENGAEGVRLASMKRYDVIFMDTRMPVLDGLTATQRIREEEQRRQLPPAAIIGLTAYAERDRCLQVGMNDYLQKPVMLYQLDQVLKAWLKLDDENEMVIDEATKVIALERQKFESSMERLSDLHIRISELRKRAGLD